MSAIAITCAATVPVTDGTTQVREAGYDQIPPNTSMKAVWSVEKGEVGKQDKTPTRVEQGKKIEDAGGKQVDER